MSKLSNLFGLLKGKTPEYENVFKTLVENSGREITRTEYVGWLDVDFDLRYQDFERFGFDLGK